MPKCPNCQHSWKETRKAKGDEFVAYIDRSGRKVFKPKWVQTIMKARAAGKITPVRDWFPEYIEKARMYAKY